MGKHHARSAHRNNYDVIDAARIVGPVLLQRNRFAAMGFTVFTTILSCAA